MVLRERSRLRFQSETNQSALRISTESALTLAQMTSFSTGFEWVANNPFVHQRGLRTALMVEATPWLSSYLSVGVSPNFGEADWTALTRELVDNNRIAPDISRIASRGMLMTRWMPIHTQGKVSSTLGLATGVGLVHTVDDLAIIQSQDRPQYQTSARQLHLGNAWSIDAEVRRENLGFRVRYDLSSFRERIGPTLHK